MSILSSNYYILFTLFNRNIILRLNLWSIIEIFGVFDLDYSPLIPASGEHTSTLFLKSLNTLSCAWEMLGANSAMQNNRMLRCRLFMINSVFICCTNVTICSESPIVKMDHRKKWVDKISLVTFVVW